MARLLNIPRVWTRRMIKIRTMKKTLFTMKKTVFALTKGMSAKGQTRPFGEEIVFHRTNGKILASAGLIAAFFMYFFKFEIYL